MCTLELKTQHLKLKTLKRRRCDNPDCAGRAIGAIADAMWPGAREVQAIAAFECKRLVLELDHQRAAEHGTTLLARVDQPFLLANHRAGVEQHVDDLHLAP